MKIAFCLALPLALAAQTTPAAKPESAAVNPSGAKSTILIDAKARSDDILKLFDTMKKEKPTYRISAHTFSGQTLSNILDLTAMPNGTLLYFRLTSTTQGIQYQIMSVEDFMDFFYS